MNKILFFIAGCCLMAGLGGCEQKIDTWSGEDVVYVDMDADSTVVSFAYMDANVDTVHVRVAVMGDVVEGAARYVKVNVKGTNVTMGQDCDALEEAYEVEGGNTFCTIPVVVKRPADQLEKELVIELVENEYFHLYYLEDVLTSGSAMLFAKTKHRVIFHNLMKEPPATWNEYYFGKFTVKKYEKICEVMEISREQFLSYSYMTFGRLRFIAPFMKDWLERNPVEDEGGSDMRMGDYLYV